MADGGANGPDYAVDLSNCDREPIHVLGKVQPFGFLIALTGCYYGMNSGRGAQGVGRATKSAVVAASVLILAANYVLTEAFFAA